MDRQASTGERAKRSGRHAMETGSQEDNKGGAALDDYGKDIGSARGYDILNRTWR